MIEQLRAPVPSHRACSATSCWPRPRSPRVIGPRLASRASLAEADRRIDSTATQLNDELDELVRQLSIGEDCLDYGLQLSPAELRVLTYLPTHLSLQEIADHLIVSRNTAKTHSVSIYRKLGAATRSEAVELARQMGILPELHVPAESSSEHENA